MWLWTITILIVSCVVKCQDEDVNEPVQSRCYNAPCPPKIRKGCGSGAESNSVVCCNISNLSELNKILSNGNITKVHIINATLSNLNFVENVLEHLTVTDSHLSRLTESFNSIKLTCVNLTSNYINYISNDVMSKLDQLEVLDVSGNNLTTLPKLNSSYLWINVTGNSNLSCQTIMDLLVVNDNVTLADENTTYCVLYRTFHWFNSTENLSLSQVKSYFYSKINCTVGCDCSLYRLEIVQGKPVTVSVHVNCSSRGLTALPEYLPAGTIFLNVSNNNITDLAPLSIDSNYQNIRVFCADNNQISSITALEGSKFIDNFQILSLKKNNIKSLPTYILSNTFDRNNVERVVNLGMNKFKCDCNAAQVVKVWLLANTKHVLDYEEVLCDSDGSKVIELDQNKVCIYQRDWTDYIYYIIAGEVFLLLLLVGKVSYDYWVFKTAGYLPWPASKMPKLPCDWVFE